jgi:thiamine-phosphate pyrophosphorylase
VVATAGQGRGDAAAVAEASFHRAEQALRSLEEYAKTFDLAAAARFEALRYRAYTLHRATGVTAESASRLASARLCVLVDGRPTVDDFAALVDALVAAGVPAIQLREKGLSDRALVERARVLRERTRNRGTLAIVNDRADVAALADADGVHVGQEDLTARDARRIAGPRRLVGVSTHSLEQARQAVLDGADYLGVGPVFPSPTKTFAAGEIAGLALVSAVSREIRLPAWMIGGITLENVGQVLAAGAERVAVASAVLGAPDPAAAARKLLDAVAAAGR